MEPTLDHVAIRVADRAAMREALLRALDWVVVEETERFTLLGADADHGKLTLLDAPAGTHPQPGRLSSLVLAAPDGTVVTEPLQLPEGLAVTFAPVAGAAWEGTPRHALIGVSLRAADPPIVAARLEVEHGMTIEVVQSNLAVLRVDGNASSGTITVSRERWNVAAEPMLDHVGIRIDDAARSRDDAEHAGLVVDRWVEAPHSRAVFIVGPEQLLLEYVELTRAFVP